jgi:hypothetical protein
MSFDWWPPTGPWPDTPGGIRGPDNRNLTDLHNLIAISNVALAAMALQIDGMSANIAQLAADVRRLVGDGSTMPAVWQGLPSYLHGNIAASDASDADTIRTSLNSSFNQLAFLNTRLDQAGLPITAGGRASQAVDMILAEAPNRATARFAIEAVAAALGSLGSAPADLTVKQLLEQVRLEAVRMADCCEEGGSGEPGDGLNDPPASFGCAPQSRVILWQDTGVTQSLPAGGGTIRLWKPLFSSATIDLAASLSYVDSGGGRVIGVNSAGKRAQVCISWDFTGGNSMVDFGRDILSTAQNALDSTVRGTPSLSGGATLQVGGLVDELNTCDGTPSQRWISWNCWFFDGVTPQLNAFLGVAQMTCPT